jgi:hypothetical protein
MAFIKMRPFFVGMYIASKNGERKKLPLIGRLLSERGESIMDAVSSLMSQWAIKSVAKAKAAAEQIKPPFIIPEDQAPASNQASPRPDGNNSGKPMTEEDGLRYLMHRGAIPPMVVNIITPGNHSKINDKPYEELFNIVWQYYRDVREEFDCPTSDYMPYFSGLPEYDPAIEKAMRDSLYQKVIDDPVCERLIKSVGGIFPPPDHVDYDTMCPGLNMQDARFESQFHK